MLVCFCIFVSCFLIIVFLLLPFFVNNCFVFLNRLKYIAKGGPFNETRLYKLFILKTILFSFHRIFHFILLNLLRQFFILIASQRYWTNKKNLKFNIRTDDVPWSLFYFCFLNYVSSQFIASTIEIQKNKRI